MIHTSPQPDTGEVLAGLVERVTYHNGQARPMKLATFNINDVNKRLANLIGWVRAELCDQALFQPFEIVEKALTDHQCA